MKRKSLIFLIACLYLPGYSQDLQPKGVATPEAAMLAKFENVPVSYYTGIPDISIPLYTIKEGDVEIPIVLKYHSSGIQVEQEATWVGLGWSLIPGGGIDQIITGPLDTENDFPESRSPFFNEIMGWAQQLESYTNGGSFVTYAFCRDPNNINDIASIDVLRTYDSGRPNLYSFTIPGGSGEFYLDPVTHVPIIIGAKNAHYFITRTATSSAKSAWEIKDIKGNTYFFTINDNEYSLGDDNKYKNIDPKLSYILLPNGKRIDFRYTDGRYQISTYTELKTYSAENPENPYDNSIFNTHFYCKFLNMIETATMKVVFELSSIEAERLDLRGDQLSDGYGAKRLNSVAIWDKLTNKKIKEFKFNYDYFNANTNYSSRSPNLTNALQKRLKLLSVQEIGFDKNDNPVYQPPYSFEYDETNPLPRKDSYARDSWGYFNGRNNQSFLPRLAPYLNAGLINGVNDLPDYVIDFLSTAGTANQGMDSAYAKSCILTKIIYPTSGYRIFNYQPNRFKNYRTFSASEIDDNIGYTGMVITDYNKIGDVVNSGPLYPDSSGKLILMDFKGGFSRIDQSIDHTYFLGANVRIVKTAANGTQATVRQWYITSDRNLFNLHGNSSFGPEQIELTAQPGEYFFVEAILPDIPELTPTNSTIPKASATCSFVIKDQNVRNTESIGGGLRIASVESYSSLNSLVEKETYSYLQDDGISTSGKLMSNLRNFSYFNYKKLLPIENPAGTEYYSTNSLYINLASFSYIPMSSDAQGELVGYDRIGVKKTSSLKDNGRTVYYYRNTPSQTYGNTSNFYGKQVPNASHLDNGLLDSVKIYDESNTLIKEITNYYKIIENRINRGFVFFDLFVGQAARQICIVGDIGPKWEMVFYPLNTKWYVPSFTAEKYYYSIGNTVKKRFFQYNSLGQLTEEGLLDSRQDTLFTKYQFPTDIASPSSIVQSLKQKNLYHLLLSKESTLNHLKKLTTQAFTYFHLPNDNYKVKSSRISVGDHPFFDDVSDIEYDLNDNITSFLKDGNYSAYLWDYNGQYPVAEAKNAQQSDLAYTGFEAESKGNWSYAGTPVADGTAPTGNKVYNPSAGAVSKSGLTSSKKYILQYWAKNSSAPAVSGSTGYVITPATVLQTRNGWTQFSRNVSKTTSLGIGGSVALDDIRLYPQEATMNTYTYDPLVGMTSKTDEKGAVTYYEYDDFQRLKAVRDQDGNLLETYCYNYKGEAVDCNATQNPEEPDEPAAPSEPQAEPVTLGYSSNIADMCNNGPLLSVAAQFSASDFKYYAMNWHVIPTGYYKLPNNSDYMYIVNGKVQSTGSCDDPGGGVIVSPVSGGQVEVNFSSTLQGTCGLTPISMYYLKETTSGKYLYLDADLTIPCGPGYYRFVSGGGWYSMSTGGLLHSIRYTCP